MTLTETFGQPAGYFAPVRSSTEVSVLRFVPRATPHISKTLPDFPQVEEDIIRLEIDFQFELPYPPLRQLSSKPDGWSRQRIYTQLLTRPLQWWRNARQDLQDRLASKRDQWIARNSYYCDTLKRLLRFIVQTPAARSGIALPDGSLLSAVEPSYALGLKSPANW